MSYLFVNIYREITISGRGRSRTVPNFSILHDSLFVSTYVEMTITYHLSVSTVLPLRPFYKNFNYLSRITLVLYSFFNKDVSTNLTNRGKPQYRTRTYNLLVSNTSR